MRYVIPVLLLVAGCAHANKETATIAPVGSPAPPLQAAMATPASPMAATTATCRSDADCTSTQLCLQSRCTAIDATTAACDTISTHFEFDQANLLANDFPELQRAARCLKARAGSRVRIEGNCDERGTTAYNLALGQRRAGSAQKYLLDLGVPSQRTAIVSYGKEQPQCGEHTESCWAQNRRDDLLEAR